MNAPMHLPANLKIWPGVIFLDPCIEGRQRGWGRRKGRCMGEVRIGAIGAPDYIYPVHVQG